jgi:voltage-gated potassium channel
MPTDRDKKIGHFRITTLLQLIISMIILFVIPVFPDHIEKSSYRIGIISLILVSAYLIESKNNRYFIVALFLLITRSISLFFDFDYLIIFQDILTVIFFAWISVKLVLQMMIKGSGVEVLLEAISGFLLLCIALTFIMSAIQFFDPNAFFLAGNPLTSSLYLASLNSYYVVITYTTVGYGDIIPMTDLARVFSKLTALTGQIYISIVIAILIGKYSQSINKTI